MVEAADPNPILRKCKVISTLIPYAVYLALDGQQGMVDTFLRVARASNRNCGEFIWHFVGRYITPSFSKQTTPSLNLVIIFASPHVDWDRMDETAVTGWAVAVSATPYTKEVGQSVVDALLQIASIHSLRPHIPISIWTWLKKQPSLPPECFGRQKGIEGYVVRHVRALGDIEILKSYFLLVWSEWDPIGYRPRLSHTESHSSLSYTESSSNLGHTGYLNEGVLEMRISIQEDFVGIGVWRHREDLINRLDYVLGQLGLGLEHLQQRKPCFWDDSIQAAKEQYGGLKKLLLEVDGEAVNTLTRMSLWSIHFGLLTPTDPYRIPLNLHVRPAPPVSITSHSLAWHYLH